MFHIQQADASNARRKTGKMRAKWPKPSHLLPLSARKM
jgi:hypothetical protein